MVQSYLRSLQLLDGRLALKGSFSRLSDSNRDRLSTMPVIFSKVHTNGLGRKPHIVELACIEWNTSFEFQCHIYPFIGIDKSATDVHGISRGAGSQLFRGGRRLQATSIGKEKNILCII